MQIYHLKTCDTCRKAIKALADRAPELFEIRKDGVPKAVLEQLLAEFGDDKVLNRKSTTWRGLSEAERARPALSLLADHPTLLKRPVILVGDSAYLGWTIQVQTEIGVI